MLRFTLCAFAAFLAFATQAQSSPKAPGRYVENIASGNLRRKFILHIPPRYRGRPIPVVVVLHGWTSNAEQAEVYTRMAEEGDAKGFVTVFPEGSGKNGLQGWNAGFMNLSGVANVDDVGFVSAVLDRVEREVNVDRRREYVAGHSNGAFLANYLGARLSNRLAAIASVAGTIGVSPREVPDPAGPISVILIHGKVDPMVAYSRSFHALLTGIGAEDSARWWAKEDGCRPDPQVTSQGNATLTLYIGGRRRTEVELVSIANGTHSWPGGWVYDSAGRPVQETATGVGAADMIWQFFRAHPKR